MYNGKRIAAIVAGGGAGERMGTEIPKQFLTIKGVPIIKKAAAAFEKNRYVDYIVVTAPAAYTELCRALLSDMKKPTVVVAGGKSRQDSVAKGLLELTRRTDFDYVLIHDGVRPYVTEEVINASLEAAVRTGAAVAAVPVKNTIRNGMLTLERDNLYAVQTPQTFAKEIILRAYEKAASDGYMGTDDGGLVERLGLPVALFPGDYANIKITTKEDLPSMERIGKGYDVHRLAPDRDLILGGVKIEHDMGLLGHSDADVLVHAIMDALLGAAALGDIGVHFPDSDEQYKGISSIELLRRVGAMLSGEGCEIVNIDSTVIAQRPKLAPHIHEMRANIAEALGLDAACVSVKATTTEGLGFAGRLEGIAADAVCMIEKAYPI